MYASQSFSDLIYRPPDGRLRRIPATSSHTTTAIWAVDCRERCSRFSRRRCPAKRSAVAGVDRPNKPIPRESL